MFGLDGFEFDGNLFAGDDVGTQIDITKATAADFAANAVFITDAKILEHPSAYGVCMCVQSCFFLMSILDSARVKWSMPTMVVILKSVPQRQKVTLLLIYEKGVEEVEGRKRWRDESRLGRSQPGFKVDQ